MLCPKCKSKTRITNNVTNHIDNEYYRERVCTECGNIFYSVEFDVVVNDDFREKWKRFNRNRSKVRENKE